MVQETQLIEIKKKVKRYRDISILIAIAVHILAMISGITLLVLFSLPFMSLLLFHGTVQALAYLNIYFGTRAYERHLRKKIRSIDNKPVYLKHSNGKI